MAKPVAPLTDRRIKLAKPTDKLYRISDGNGLCIKILISGSKIWEYRYVNPLTNKQDTIVIGNYPEISLARAREIHAEKRDIVLRGKDPKIHEESRRVFRDLFEEWYLQWSPNRDPKYSQQAYRYIHDNSMRYLGGMKIDEIQVSDVVKAISPFIKRGTYPTAKRMKSIISQTIDYGCDLGLARFNVVKSMSNSFIPEPEKKEENEDEGYEWLKLSEVYKMHVYLELSRSHEITRLAAEMVMRTASRPGAICKLKWEHIDFETNIIEIPGSLMKKRNPHAIPITPHIMSILDRAKKWNVNGHVFPRMGRTGDKLHLSEGTPRNSLRAFNLETTAHGFRKTASTLLYETLEDHNVPPLIIEEALGHLDANRSRAPYKKSRHIKQKEILLNFWNNFIDASTTAEKNLKQLNKYDIR